MDKSRKKAIFTSAHLYVFKEQLFVQETRQNKVLKNVLFNLFMLSPTV